MTKRNIRALTNDRKAPEDQPTDSIPAMYRQAAALTTRSASVELEGLSRALSDQSLALERLILRSPARSLEGAARQLQTLAGLLDNAGSLDNVGLPEDELFRALWLAIFGTLNYLLPQFPPVKDEPNYDLGTVDACPGTGFSLFHSIQRETAI